MPINTQDDDKISDGVNLLISILVRFPEIGTVSYIPHNHSLKLTFLLSAIPSEAEFTVTKNLILKSITAYHMLENVKASITEIQLSTFENVAMLTMVRDVSTLSKGEIAVIITLLRERLKESLVTDNNNTMLEEDLLVQEELIDSMLENVKQQRTAHGLIGIREDGKVFVFNK